MNAFTRVVLLSAAAILVYDTGMSAASRVLGFPYASAAIGSYVIYAAAGFFGARAGGGIGWGGLAGLAAGLTDATVGWLISAAIGPGRPPPGSGVILIAFAAVYVTALAGVVGILGALAARLFRTRSGDGRH